jgi:acyl-CoA hydrolase
MTNNLYKESHNNITFSRAETSLIMDPIHSNSQGSVHGGEMMKIMDNIAGIVAFKHAKGTVVTARVDEIVFHKPVNIGNVVTCIGQLTYVGSSSMQIKVNLVIHDVENYSQPETALTAFFTMVHLVDGKPAKVPELVVTNKEEEELYRLGEKKHNEIKAKYLRK